MFALNLVDLEYKARRKETLTKEGKKMTNQDQTLTAIDNDMKKLVIAVVSAVFAVIVLSVAIASLDSDFLMGILVLLSGTGIAVGVARYLNII